MSRATVYHMMSAADWQDIGIDDTYYPATFAAEGFIHATADQHLLLPIANHFHADATGEIVCLEIPVAALDAANITVKFEPPAAVGDKPAQIDGVSLDGILFPHIYGGLKRSFVTCAHPVTRDDEARFVEIESLQLAAL
ncbi:MAG: DUF952 domain-containing protein [Pseudomonadota bacterium]